MQLNILVTIENIAGFQPHFTPTPSSKKIPRQPETVFVPQMFVPENGQSLQRVGCLLFQASRALALALALTRT